MNLNEMSEQADQMIADGKGGLPVYIKIKGRDDLVAVTSIQYKYVPSTGYPGCSCGTVVIGTENEYGLCPHCGEDAVSRERRLNGNDTCRNGHIYPSKSSMKPATLAAEIKAEQGGGE